jgi:hypothetical protein
LIEAGPEKGAFVTPRAVADLRRQLGQQLEHVVVDLPHTIPSTAPDVLARHVSAFISSGP